MDILRDLPPIAGWWPYRVVF